MHIHSNQNGGTRFKVFLWFVFLFLMAHVSFKIVPLYMDYTRMKDEMTTKASLAQILTDEQIKIDLEKKAKELDLPLVQESFILSRDDQKRNMKITAKWDVEVNFFWGVYTRSFHFDPLVTESFMSVLR